MSKVYGPDFEARPAAGKNFYLRWTVEKMYALLVFTEKCLRPSICSDSNFMAVVNCTDPKHEMQSKIIEIEIIQIQF